MELVSIIITTYKGHDKLGRAIDSVLAQTYPNIEIIVVDDNTRETEDRYLTEKVMELYQNDNIIYLKHDVNRNGAAARNTGIKVANGKYITFLDDDDYIVEDRIEEAVIQLKRNSASIFLCSVCVVRKNIGIKIVHIPREICVKDILLNDSIIGTGSNLFLEKDVVNAVYGFDESFKRYQDREFLVRICSVGKVCTSDKVQVVKSENTQNNIPNFYMMKNIEDKFITKFNTEFNALSSREKRQYELNKMHMLFKLALDTEDVGEIRQVYGSIKNQNDLYWYEVISYILVKINAASLVHIKHKIMPFMAKVKNFRFSFEIRKYKKLWKFIENKEGLVCSKKIFMFLFLLCGMARKSYLILH